MARQHATPVYIPSSGSAWALNPVPQTTAGGVLEDFIQALVHNHPTILPVAEIDPIFKGAIAICRELETLAGPIDNFLVTPSGLPVLVECKLWRNAEARREVVGKSSIMQRNWPASRCRTCSGKWESGLGLAHRHC